MVVIGELCHLLACISVVSGRLTKISTPPAILMALTWIFQAVQLAISGILAWGSWQHLENKR